MKKWSVLAVSLAVVTLVGCTQNVNNAEVPVTQLTPSVAQYLTYTVQKGDTLSGIADQYQLSYIDLARVNDIPSPYIIHIGQVLRIPNPKYTGNNAVQQQQEYGGDIQPISNENALPAQNLNLADYGSATATAAAPAPTAAVAPKPAVSTSTGPALATGAAANASTTQAVQSAPPPSKPVAIQTSTQPDKAASAPASVAGQSVSVTKQVSNDGMTWSWPVSGRIVEGFGQGQGLMAKGLQIRTQSDAKVLAATEGTVIYSGMGVNDYGKMIIIKSDNNFLTAYTNLSKLLVQQGQTIIRGGPIGIVGAINGQPILHFEVRKFGSPVDPMQYMPS